MPIYDEDPRPRVLVSGVSNQESGFVQVVARYAPTAYLLPGFGLAPGIRWESWDALVSVGAPYHYNSHLFILQVGGTPHGRYRYSEQASRSFTTARSYGPEFETNDDLDRDLKDLVKSELIPLIRESPTPRDVFVVPEFADEESYAIPLVTDLDGNAFAAIYRPDKAAREVIYLPDTVTDIRPWLLYAFERWSAFESTSFPVAPDWTDAAEWMTAEEIDARETWDRARDHAERARDEAERIERESQSALRELREQADLSERILLTGTGDELVQAVAGALTRLGFVVEDRDAIGAREKLEDLRVRDGDWIALCEVKGYTKGGSVTDMVKINRFVERYVRDTNAWPDARWYVVNQFKDRDPSSRMQLLRGQDEDVEGFAESNGLAIDTRSLFLLDKAVANGEIDKGKARTLLREAVGRFGYGL